MKRVVLVFVLAAGCAYADSACGSATDATGYGYLNNAIGGLVVGGVTGISGCLSVTNTDLQVAPSSGTSYTTQDLDVTWKVTEPTAGNYVYSYTFEDASEISHVVLGLSSHCSTMSIGASSDCINTATGAPGGFNPTYTGYGVVGSTLVPGDPESPCTGSETGSTSTSNPCIPLKSGSPAVTFQPASSWSSGETLTFDSKEAPVFQDIYIRDLSQEAFNTGADVSTSGSGLTLTSTAEGYFVATPGVPEPAFYGLLALGLSSLFLARRVNRKQSTT
jgi:hypothetical protein